MTKKPPGCAKLLKAAKKSYKLYEQLIALTNDPDIKRCLPKDALIEAQSALYNLYDDCLDAYYTALEPE